MLKLTKTGIFALLALIYMANMLLTTEVHYSIDIFAGILFGLWFFRFATRYTIYFDRAFSLPFVGFRKIVECLKKENIDESLASVNI